MDAYLLLFGADAADAHAQQQASLCIELAMMETLHSNFGLYDVEERSKVVKRRRLSLRLKPDRFKESCWGRMLRDSTWRDGASRDGEKFLLRFRVKPSMFETMVSEARSCPEFNDEGVDCCGQRKAPLELLILGFLRVIGRGVCFDCVMELRDVGEETFRFFFHKYTRWGARKYYDCWVYPPRTEEELRASMDAYYRQGLAGIFGETDCTHIYWLRCTASEKAKHTGKEGYPTRAYEITANQSGRIFSVSKGQYGTRNDLTIVLFDGFMRMLREGLYANVEFSLFDRFGNEKKMKGPATLVDGGYHKWKETICGDSVSDERTADKRDSS